jgi:1-deoxy-D-xylulose 5-phosphate reductoisomerase
VALFLEGRISFVDIPRTIDAALDALGGLDGSNRAALLTADECSRRFVREMFGC